ncbi:MAG: ATP-binding domain-containing protein, partial [Propionibacteriaceae bacterium]|jgi:DNA helicase IV|nr:ATP-binding domain-containing protein [Propionibacteriaceae bacterium]
VRQLIDQTSHIRHLRQRRLEVASTLRVKGLEYDHVILLDPADVPSAEHLYVALSRAKHKITIAVQPNGTLGQWLAT